MVLELCERNSSLGAEALRAVAAEFHENTGTASLAADTVALSVERFEVSAIGALVVDEFNHVSLSSRPDLASRFESVDFDKIHHYGKQKRRTFGMFPRA